MLENERARFEAERAELQEARAKFLQSGQVDEEYKQNNIQHAMSADAAAQNF